MHEVLVNRLGLSLPRKSVVWLTDRPNMTLDVNRGRKNNTTSTTTELTVKGQCFHFSFIKVYGWRNNFCGFLFAFLEHPGLSQLQIRGGTEDNSEIIFLIFSMKTYVVIPH